MTTGGQAEGSAGDDVQQLQHEIEQTRDQLGETVGQLAAKADVKAVAKTKASEVSERMKSKVDMARQQAVSTAGNVRTQLAGKADQAKHQATTAAGSVRGQVADRTATVRQKAQTAGQSGKDQIVAAGTPVWDATPEPVRKAVAKGASNANERKVPLVIVVGVLVAGLLVLRRLRSR